MHAEGIELFVASAAALIAGPLLYHLAGRSRAAVAVVHASVVLAILALVVLHILPECVEVAGWVALVAAGVGLLAPALVGHRVHAALAERPTGVHRVAIGVALVALVLHAFTDGMAFLGDHGHAHSHEGVNGLGLAVVLHRLPEGAALFWLLRGFGWRAIAGAVTLVIGATLAGFVLGDHVLEAAGGAGVALFQAFVAGVLLEVIVHRHHAGHTSPAHREA